MKRARAKEARPTSRLEAAALARITKRDVQACLARWVTCPASAAHLAVHVVGRAHEAAGAGAAAGEEAACPPPGRARITLTRGGSVEVWEGGAEEIAEAFGEEKAFPCFVSGD